MRIARPLLVRVVIGGAVAAAGQSVVPPSPLAIEDRWGRASVPSIRITSPLGRTGLVTRVRIVAQVAGAAQATCVAGRASSSTARASAPSTDGPPYAVEWTRRQPVRETRDYRPGRRLDGHTLRDTVMLPPFEVIEKTEVTGVLLETAVYDKAGRFVLGPDRLRIHRHRRRRANRPSTS